MMNDDRKPISIQEAARLLGIGRTQAYEAAHRGELPVIKIGRRLLVPRPAFDRLINGEGAAL